jgi:NADH-quinone oxidoreductase subunit N
VKANLIWLTIIGVVNGGVGAYYYLRIIVMMYMRESRKEVPVTPVPFALGIALATCLVATLYLGLFPSRVLRFTQDSAQQLVRQAPSEIPSSVPVPLVPASL